MTEFVGFEKFLFQEDADYLQQLLHQNGIEVELETPKSHFDAIVGHSRDNEYFIIKIPLQKFDTALRAIEKDLEEKGIPADYPLREMSRQELMDILAYPDKWSRFDSIGAKILLAEKGVEVSDTELKKMELEREQKITTERTISNPAYFLLIIISFLGWFFPIIGGLMIYCLKQTDREGKKVPFFSEQARTQGLILAGIGVLSTAGWYWLLS
ncbi:MAG: hypothetical protein V4722_21605 [Bacteroidota bacterium]